jgi:hypothetical protein
MLDFFAADGTPRVLEKLRLTAPLIFAEYHKRFAADIAFLTARKGFSSTEGTHSGQRSAASGADRVSPLDFP